MYESEDPTTCNNTGITGTCGAPYTPHQAIVKYDSIHGENANDVPSVDSMKYHIYYHGPIWVAVAADDWPDGLVDSIWVEGIAGICNHAVCTCRMERYFSFR